METIKLTQPEIQTIEKLKEQFAEKVNTFGVLHYQLLDLEERKQQIEKELLTIRSEEQSLFKELSEKYGEGTILLESGEFVKN